MKKKSDPTEKIVLGISLLIVVVCGYFAWSTREENIMLRKGDKEEGIRGELEKAREYLENTRSEYLKLKKKLVGVSEIVGLNERFIDSKKEDEYKVRETPFQSYESIDSLKQEGRLVSRATEIFKERGFSDQRIEEITSSKPETEEVLKSIYLEEWSRTRDTVTNIDAMANFLNDSLSILNMTKDLVEFDADKDEKWVLRDEEDADESTVFRGLEEKPQGVTITRYLREYNEAIKSTQNRIDQVKKKISNARTNFHKYVGAGNKEGEIVKIRRDRVARVDKLRGKIDTLHNQVDSAKQTLAQRVQAGIQERNKAEEEIDSIQSDLKSQTIDLQEEKEILRNRKKAILARRRAFKARQKRGVDGKLLFVNQDTGTVFVDIGEEDGLLTGTEFNVYDLIKGGVRIEKGTIRITQLFEDYSRAAIVQQSDPINHPMRKEDFVFNVAFNREQKKIFVLAGFMKGKYNREMLKQLIRKKGNRVDKDVTLDTTYVVVGEGYENDPNYKKAKKLNIPIINQKQLERMLDLR